MEKRVKVSDEVYDRLCREAFDRGVDVRLHMEQILAGLVRTEVVLPEGVSGYSPRKSLFDVLGIE